MSIALRFVIRVTRPLLAIGNPTKCGSLSLSLRFTNYHSKYLHERKTSDDIFFGVRYFVKDNFESEFRNNIREVEHQVIEEYVTTIRSNCYKERNHREAMLWRARAYRDTNLEQKAQDFRMPNCDKLHKFQKYGFY